MRVIFATHNPGKVEEAKKLGQQYNIDVVSLADVGVDLYVQETGSTFEENARLKLAHAQAALANNTVDWIVADDSGLMIDALGGEPGVKSRRWAGHDMTDEELINYTLQKLGSTPPPERTASFKCVIAAGKVGKNPLIFEDILEGSILITIDNSVTPQPGFPYRQLFFVPELARTLGAVDTMSPTEIGSFKNHRQKAFERLFRYINDVQSVTGQFE